MQENVSSEDRHPELPSYFGVQLLSMIIAIQGKAAVSLMTRDMCIGGRLIFSINIGSALLETVPVSSWYQK